MPSGARQERSHRHPREHRGEAAEGDGMVTAESGILLAVASADCVPILMTMRVARSSVRSMPDGAESSRGLRRRVCARWSASARGRMRFARRLGPSIGQCCFEVDEDLAHRFAREVAGSERHSRPGRPGKAHLDLRGIITDQLMRAGLPRESIINVGPVHQMRERPLLLAPRRMPPRACKSASSASRREVFCWLLEDSASSCHPEPSLWALAKDLETSKCRALDRAPSKGRGGF